jgi:PAS domain-containing protein
VCWETFRAGSNILIYTIQNVELRKSTQARAPQDFVLPEHQDHAALWLAGAYHGKDTRNIDMAVRKKCGARVDLLLSTLSRSRGGGGGGAILVGHDITLRKRAEGQPEHELQTFMATANAPIVGIDAACSINVWNDTMSSLTGYSSEEVIGKDWQVCIPGRDVAAVPAAAAAVRALRSAARVPYLPPHPCTHAHRPLPALLRRRREYKDIYIYISCRTTLRTTRAATDS